MSGRMELQDWLALLALSLLWGGSFFFAAVALGDLPPLSLVAARVVLAAAALFLVLAATGGLRRVEGRLIGAFLIMGALNNAIPFSLLFWGQTMIPSGLASILNAMTPISAMLIAHLALADERLSLGKLAGVGLGVAGVTLIIGPDALAGDRLAVTGMLACLGATLSYGCAAVFGRRFRALGVSPAMTALGQLCGSSLLMTPVALALDRPWRLEIPGGEALGAVAALAIASTAVAYLLFFRVLARAGAVNVSLVTLLVPVSAILLGALILGERLASADLAGMALIGVGLLVIDGRLVRRRRLTS